MHSSQHLFYRNKSMLFFAHFFQIKPVSKLIYLLVMGWVQCFSTSNYCKNIFITSLAFAKSAWKLCFGIITSYKREQLLKRQAGRHACIVVYSLHIYFLVVANFGCHSHFHKAKALNCCTIVKKVFAFRKTSHVFNAENIYQFLHPNTNCLSCMLLETSSVFIPMGEF